MFSGASDGYFNRWSPDSGNTHGNWPVKSKAPPITFIMTRTFTEDSYMWSCTRCGKVFHTDKYIRPNHDCREDIDKG